MKWKRQNVRNILSEMGFLKGIKLVKSLSQLCKTAFMK